MRLSDLKILIKKLYLYLLAVGVLIAFGLIAYYIYDNPSGDQGFGKLPQIKFKNLLSAKIKLVGTVQGGLSLPRLVEVYRYQGFEQPATIAAKLGFSGQPQNLGGSWVWDVSPRRFKVQQDSYDFTFNDIGKTITSNFVDQDKARQKALDFIKTLGLTDTSVEVYPVSTGFVNSQGPEFEVVERTKPFNVYSFNIGVKIGGYNIVNFTGSPVVYNVWVGVDGRVTKANGNLQLLKLTGKSTYPVKKAVTIRNEIESGKISIANFTSAITNSKELDVDFNFFKLVYLSGKSNENFLQPVVIFTGFGSSTTGQVVGMTDALKGSVYSK